MFKLFIKFDGSNAAVTKLLQFMFIVGKRLNEYFWTNIFEPGTHFGKGKISHDAFQLLLKSRQKAQNTYLGHLLLLLSESKNMTFNEHSVGVKRHKTLSSSNSRYNCEEDGDVSIEDGDGGRGGGLPEVFWGRI